MAAVAFTLTACGDDDGHDGISVTITGIPAYSQARDLSMEFWSGPPSPGNPSNIAGSAVMRVPAAGGNVTFLMMLPGTNLAFMPGGNYRVVISAWEGGLPRNLAVLESQTVSAGANTFPGWMFGVFAP